MGIGEETSALGSFYRFALRDAFRLHVTVQLPKKNAGSLHLRILVHTHDAGSSGGAGSMYVSWLKLLDGSLLVKFGSTELIVYRAKSIYAINKCLYINSDLPESRREQRAAVSPPNVGARHTEGSEFVAIERSLPVHSKFDCLYTFYPPFICSRHSQRCSQC